MYVRRLTLTNLRGFRSATVDLRYPGSDRDQPADFRQDPTADSTLSSRPRLPNVTVFLGMNGSGKSTLLEAIALALISPIVASSGYRPQYLIRRSNHGKIDHASIEAELAFHERDGEGAGILDRRFKTHVQRRGDLEFLHGSMGLSLPESFFEDEGPAFFFVGYGASRRAEAVSASDLAQRRRVRAVRYDRVATLFEEHLSVLPLSVWLPALRSEKPDLFMQVEKLLGRLLPKQVRFTGEMEGGDYLFRNGSVDVPYSALSDGYKVYIGWVSDLLYHLVESQRSDEPLSHRRGLVMVDEIDLHIHPAWQRTIIPTLAKTFKNLQFVFTSHSPLVAGTLERSNLYFVSKGRGGLPRIERPDEETLGLSADQILTSPVFGLDSTRDPEFRKEMDRLADAAEAGVPGAALDLMRKAALGAGDAPPLGPTPEWLKNLATES
jgi:energy-coupling factor transporter ATP-binding protein EcfA2